MNDQAFLSRAEKVKAEAEQATGEWWGRWANSVLARLARLECRVTALLGDDDTGEIGGNEEAALPALLRDLSDGERRERAESIGKLADAWTERLSAEISTLDERLSEKLDSKIFDAASIRQFKSDVSEAGCALRADIEKLFDGLSARFAELERRIDASDARRRVDRQALRERSREDLTRAAALVGGMVSKVNQRLDAQDARLDAIEAALADQSGPRLLGAWGST
jgi:hypothetical protein